ncbi:TPA: hypothetical protein N0F65_003868 [Lagenidium giganteum]|uniref:Uncharacterized protein n=1 Tax=Lagenidium giganteum TaxID=4803 RepID=A0AAV2Z6X8_9STRA|nr:TPA: hypothetical protein N0F65_003868 [Lagenidium giganteum]
MNADSTSGASTPKNIPTATSQSPGALGKRYTVYKVQVHYQSGQVVQIEKRYSDFRQLHKVLRHKYATVGRLFFPPKKYFMSLSLHVIEQRREALDHYLNAVLSLRPRPVELVQFLAGGVDQMDEDDVESDIYSDMSSLRHDTSMSIYSSTGSTASTSRSSSFSLTRGEIVNMSDFEILKMLGKGSFGKVYMVRKVGSDDILAMKVLRKSELVKRNQVHHTMTERRIMSSINHPFIVPLRYAFQTSSKLVMISDYCCGGEIFFHLKKFRSFSEAMVRFYAAELILKAPLKFPAHFGLSPEVKNLISALLERDPTYRIGCRPGAGVEDIKNHPFFMEIDWQALDNREVRPPFKPRVKSPTDIQNFDKEFTREIPDSMSFQQDKRLVISPKNEFHGFSFTRRSFSNSTRGSTADPRMSGECYDGNMLRNFSIS